jgi:hypothetical protein
MTRRSRFGPARWPNHPGPPDPETVRRQTRATLGPTECIRIDR